MHSFVPGRGVAGRISDWHTRSDSFIRRAQRIFKCRAAAFVALLLAVLSAAAQAQTGTATAVVTLGVPVPVAGQQFTVYALATNPNLTPAPTGSIQFDFGDGTPTVTVPMDYRVSITTHIYASTSTAHITATYLGDSNFAPVSTTVSGQVLTSVPAVTLNTFGDSISASGNTVSSTVTNWTGRTAYVHNWQLNNPSVPGYRTADECPYMYSAAITPASYTAIFLGENDWAMHHHLRRRSIWEPSWRAPRGLQFRPLRLRARILR